MINNFNNFLSTCNKIANVNNFASDWFGGIGLGFIKDDLVLKKLYFNFEKNIDIDSFPLIEVKELYKKFLPSIDSSRCAFNSIAIKKNTINNEYTNYFHVKLNPGFNFNCKDKILNIDLNILKKGVSVEFNNSTTSIKRYYYITNKDNISALLCLFKITENVDKIKYLEYTHNPKKIILIYNDILDVFNAIKNNFSSNIINNIVKINEDYNVVPSLFGKYLLGKKTAIYWDLYKQNFNLLDVIL